MLSLKRLSHLLLQLIILFNLTACGNALSKITFVSSTLFNLKRVGYQQNEFFLTGTADSYLVDGDLGSDGLWDVIENEQADYKTRVLVNRPIDPSKFNGTVIVEWINVSGNTDATPEWILAHNEFMREGYVWVGVSAQRKGIDNQGPIGLFDGIMDLSLKTVNPWRYNQLSHPGDSFSYSIYTQAAEAVRYSVEDDLLGGLEVERMIAAGDSQSAVRLISYINLFGKESDLFEGYLIHSRVGSSAPISESPLEDVIPPDIVTVRADLGKPVLMLQTESDLFFGSDFIPSNAYESRQDDSDTFRLWEVAGTSHGDAYTLAGLMDSGINDLYAMPLNHHYALPGVIKCDTLINGSPFHHFVAGAAYHALDQWIRNGVAPPEAPRIATAGDPLQIARDEHGNAIGGIRSPYIDVPTATYLGIGKGHIACELFGQMAHFSRSKLRTLYGDRTTYIEAVKASTEDAISKGFLRPADGELIGRATKKLARAIY